MSRGLTDPDLVLKHAYTYHIRGSKAAPSPDADIKKIEFALSSRECKRLR